MKKKHSLFTIKLVICFMLTLLSSCSGKEEVYKCFVTDVANDDMAGKINIEYSLSKNEHKSLSAPKTYTVTFDGKEYNGEYEKTLTRNSTSNEVNKYVCEDGTAIYTDKDNSFSGVGPVFRKDYYQTEPKLSEVSEEELEKAKKRLLDIITEYINVDDYVMEETEKTIRDNEEERLIRYTILYYKTINGVRTTDFLSAGYNSKGNIEYLLISDTGAFDEYKKQYESEEMTIDSKKIESATKEKLQSIYKEKIEKTEDLTYDIEGQRYYISEKGQLMLVSDIGVNIKGEDFSRGIQMAIIIE